MELNDDVLLEIFAKLPAGLIPRLKSVCRKWYTLLSSPWLRTELFPRSTMSGLYVDCWWNKFWADSPQDTDPACFAVVTEKHSNNEDDNDDKVREDVTFSYFPTDPQSEGRVRILHVSDGLLLCKYRTTATFVTNPITRTYELLPPLPEPNGFDVFHMVLGFDRSNDGDNYVVLATLLPVVGSIHSTYVFSRRIGKWTPFDCENQQGKGESSGLWRPFLRSLVTQTVLYIDGVFFFYQFRVIENEYMFVVDVDKGLIREVKVPLQSEKRELCLYSMGKKSDGCLVFGGFRCSNTWREDDRELIRSSRFRMWMLEDVRSENWELKIDVDFGNSLPADYLDLTPDMIFQFRVVGFHPDYEIVFFTTRHEGCLFALGTRSKSITRICSNLQLRRDFFVYTPLWVDIFANQFG